MAVRDLDNLHRERKIKQCLIIAALLFCVLLFSGSTGCESGHVGINTYYVSPDGNDNLPGFKEIPFRTIGKAVSVAQAGDTVLVRAGTYNETVTFGHSGASAVPITIKAYPGETPKMDGGGSRLVAFDYNGQSYITVDGFEITNYNTADVGGSWIDLDGAVRMQGSNITLQNCNIHHFVESPGGNGCGVVFWGGPNINIINNHIVNVGSQNVGIKEGTVNNLLLRGNVIQGGRCIMCFLPRCDRAVIEQNEFGPMRHNYAGGSTHTDMIFAESPISFTVRNNYFHDGHATTYPGDKKTWTTGILCNSHVGTQIYNNLFVRVDGCPVYASDSGGRLPTNNKVFDNTVINCANGGNLSNVNGKVFVFPDEGVNYIFNNK